MEQFFNFLLIIGEICNYIFMNENYFFFDDFLLFLIVVNLGLFSEVLWLIGILLLMVLWWILKLQVDLDKMLFLCGKNGFLFIFEGCELVECLLGLKDVEYWVCQWLDVDDRFIQVWIIIGFMIVCYLVFCFLLQDDQGVCWIFSFVVLNVCLDIVRYEVDIGICRIELVSNWLVWWLLWWIIYVFYVKDEMVIGYVSMFEIVEFLVFLKWLYSCYGYKVVVWGFDFCLCLDMVIVGYG